MYFLFGMYFSKKIFNLLVSIPPFSYSSNPSTPLLDIANIVVYFLNTCCDLVFITQINMKNIKTVKIKGYFATIFLTIYSGLLSIFMFTSFFIFFRTSR